MLHMRITKRDLFTPANVVTVCGLVLTVVGSLKLNTWPGFAAVLIGRLLDILDGPVARRTHTSRFGAVLDATADKLTLLAMAIGLLAFELAPVMVVAYILLQNIGVSIVNTLASLRKITVHSTVDGKWNIFLQCTSMLLFVLGCLVGGATRTVITALAYIALVASFYFAARATRDYFRILKPKSPKTT
jgi:phosphatidylglycerophosphate synthase